MPCFLHALPQSYSVLSVQVLRQAKLSLYWGEKGLLSLMAIHSFYLLYMTLVPMLGPLQMKDVDW